MSAWKYVGSTRRNAIYPTAAELAQIASTTRRGLTGQEHLDNLALIHLNGRVYDPFAARFISADPFIPDPLDTQSYNRYSYVNNRALSFTDPSGFHPCGESSQVETYDADGNFTGYDLKGGMDRNCYLGIPMDISFGNTRVGRAGYLSGHYNFEFMTNFNDAIDTYETLVDLAPSPALGVDTEYERQFAYRYASGQGGTAHLTAQDFADIKATIDANPGIVSGGAPADDFTGERNIFFAQVKGRFDSSLGTASGIWEHGELVGIRDQYDFNPRPKEGAGSRSTYGASGVERGIKMAKDSFERNCKSPTVFQVTYP